MTESNSSDRINISITKNVDSVEYAKFFVNKTQEILSKPNEYEIQVKSLKIDMTQVDYIPDINTSDYSVGINLITPNQNIYTSSLNSLIPIKNPIDLANTVNTAFLNAFNAFKTANPSYTNTLRPTVFYNTTIERFQFFADEAFWQGGFSTFFTFSPLLFKKLNFSGTYGQNVNKYALDLPRNSSTEIVFNSINCYFTNSLSFPHNFSNIDEIVIQSSQIPIYETINQTQNDKRTSILKSIKYKYDGSNIFVYNYTNEEYYSIDSHYPLKQLDISIFLKLTNGEYIQLLQYPNDYFSVNIEFKRKNIF